MFFTFLKREEKGSCKDMHAEFNFANGKIEL